MAIIWRARQAIKITIFHPSKSIKMAGWWYTYPSEKYDFVSWDDDIPN